jgi:phage gpG-like protein
MVNVRVEFNEERMKALANVPAGWKSALAKWLGKTAQEIKEEIRSKFHIRTGQLWRNIGWQITGEEEMIGEIGTGVAWAKSVVYARIHELGGDITPKRAQALTIPMPGVKGVAKNYPDAFCVKLKGKPFLAQREGAKLKVLFFLAKQVSIPARPYMRPVLNRREPELRQAIDQVIKGV